VPEVFHYCVKIISSAASKNIIRQVHDFKGKFSSVPAMKVFMMEKFADHLPDDINLPLVTLKESSQRKDGFFVRKI